LHKQTPKNVLEYVYNTFDVSITAIRIQPTWID